VDAHFSAPTTEIHMTQRLDPAGWWLPGSPRKHHPYAASAERRVSGSRVRRLVPHPGNRLAENSSRDDVKPLTVMVDRLEQWWRPGLLCIGDPAHAMSPIAGVRLHEGLSG
jgi:2-polyprenyl-6-methoxyphenol hydroxylase-like FAD-dependent oxidoreductase